VVAECSVYFFLYFLISILKIGINNVDVSSVKKCEKHFRLKSKGFWY